ncbi:Xaa-Pro aminopeptidase [Cognatiyoonia koreensis]|uniref:Xaa-Pro aminopeptidase n=1 Tax=Cognatiyoonia koreensis TaxID=364200 RepID=A0A1I0QW92_9RHOB|nr:Xaa-Pro peptidase family protein [Cognatiyoonia koreensis]SEW31988.1 Xaa-Pro aminopeptidase [Cognatiyoonia koreensis]
MIGGQGFPDREFETRVARAQAVMAKYQIAALLLTTEPDVRYVTGFLTRFWESPTRPWFVVLPAAGKPIAVIPSIGANLMGSTWIEDIRCWSAPNYTDDGVSLLIETLGEVTEKGDTIGVPSGIETHLRFPLDSWQRVQSGLSDRTFGGDSAIMRDLRMIKSDAEIAKIKDACNVGHRAFSRVAEIASAGVALRDVFRRFQILCLEEGADYVPYLAGAAEKGGYADVISPATNAALEKGHVMMLDTGLMLDGYFCDFDRNFSIGQPDTAVAGAHEKLVIATRTAFEQARPGQTAADLFHAMLGVVGQQGAGADAGRFGHGLGMQLTEGLSIIPNDHTVLAPGMVLTLEPCIALGSGKIMVHEENIAIRQTGAEWLTVPAKPEIDVIP